MIFLQDFVDTKLYKKTKGQANRSIGTRKQNARKGHSAGLTGVGTFYDGNLKERLISVESKKKS